MDTILVVEDEESYREPLAFSLRRDGFEVLTAADGEKALFLFERNSVDLVLLDLMLPGVSGVEVCRKLRQTSTVPVIMVTAKDDVVERIVGLELGADDYVAKPYSYGELLARVRAVLRRRFGKQDSDQTLEVGPIVMDIDQHIVKVRGEETDLPLREFELLEILLRHPDRVLTRDQLIDRVWGEYYVGGTKTLDVHVKRLRAKIEKDPAHPKLLRTVRGVGYKLVQPNSKSTKS